MSRIQYNRFNRIYSKVKKNNYLTKTIYSENNFVINVRLKIRLFDSLLVAPSTEIMNTSQIASTIKHMFMFITTLYSHQERQAALSTLNKGMREVRYGLYQVVLFQRYYKQFPSLLSVV